MAVIILSEGPKWRPHQVVVIGRRTEIPIEDELVSLLRDTQFVVVGIKDFNAVLRPFGEPRRCLILRRGDGSFVTAYFLAGACRAASAVWARFGLCDIGPHQLEGVSSFQTFGRCGRS